MKPSPGSDAGGGYGAREVSRMLGLTVGQVRAWVRSGLVDPERGPRGELRFSPQDLRLLQAVQGLAGARIGPRRIGRALSKLLAQVPAAESIGALEIRAEGRRIVVTDGSARWQPESGQMLMEFEENGGTCVPFPPVSLPPSGQPLRSPGEPGGGTADSWYQRGCDLEERDPGSAREAYEKALLLDPSHADAHVNLGRLLHEAGEAAAAEGHYESALAARPDDSTAAFNLGVALEDLGRDLDAIDAYEKAVALDPHHADAYFNLAGACERVGRPAEAIRYLKAHRALVRSPSQ
ncbi:MAG TPA: tetratricopeptide repeat protein [Thermoanaerobaculia bacterium]|nr:tetratricopeptide repeat protein [Thermoanaerobaculia bacterium]